MLMQKLVESVRDVDDRALICDVLDESQVLVECSMKKLLTWPNDVLYSLVIARFQALFKLLCELMGQFLTLKQR